MAVEFETLLFQLEANSQQLQREVNKGRSVVDRATNRMKAGFDRLNAQIESATRRVFNFRTGIAAAMGAAGLGFALKRTLDFAGRLSDVADRVDFSIERLQILRFAFQQNGVEVRETDASLRRFTRRLGLAAEAMGPAAIEYERLGINVKDANGNLREAEDVFADVVRALAGMETQAERAAAASQFFGEDAGPALGPLLGQGMDAIKAYEDQLRSLGGVMSTDLVKAGDAAADQLDALALVIQTNFRAGLMTGFLGDFKTFTEAVGDPAFQRGIFLMAEQMGGLASFLVRNYDKLIRIFGAWLGVMAGRVLGPVGSAAGGLAGFFGPELAKILEDIFGINMGLGKMNEQLKEMEMRRPPPILQPSTSERFNKFIKQLDKQNQLLRMEADGRRELIPLMEAQAKIEEQLKRDLTDVELQKLKERIELTTQLTKRIELQQEIVDSMQGVFDRFGDGMVDAMQKGIDQTEAMNNAFKALVFDLQREIIRLAVFKPLKEGLGFLLSSAISGVASAFTPAAPAAPTTGNYGSSFFGPSFATGGVVKAQQGLVVKPTRFLAGEGPDTEAIFPLARTSGGRLGVRAVGGGGNNQAPIIYMDLTGANGNTEIEDAVRRGIAQAAPALIGASVKKVENLAMRGGSFTRALRGR